LFQWIAVLQRIELPLHISAESGLFPGFSGGKKRPLPRIFADRGTRGFFSPQDHPRAAPLLLYFCPTVKTRNMKGPRSYDASGIPRDNQTVVKERIYLDKADRSLMRDEITTIDHALTRPWVVMKTYRRVATDKPIWWREDICA
jgi:hypothetical protein